MTLVQARHLVEIGRWSEAESALGPSLADPTDGAEPWCLLAQCRLSQKDWDGTERAARRALALEPDEEWAHRLLAIALLGRSKGRQALVSARRAAELAPTRPSALNVLALALTVQRGSGAEAREVADRSVRSNPHSPVAWHTVAVVANDQRRWADAELAARNGLREAPEDGDLLLDLATALEGQGRHGHAGEVYRSAALADPGSGAVRRRLGRIGLPLGVGLVFFSGKLGALKAVYAASVFHRNAALALAAAAVVGSAVFAVQEARHRRARSQLAPDLQRIAAHARRPVYLGWTAGAVVVAVLAVITAATAGSVAWALLAASALAACLVVLRRLDAVHAVAALPVVQSMRRRLR